MLLTLASHTASSPEVRFDKVIDIIIPVYNEQENILVLLEQIRSLGSIKGFTFRPIIVDDGSQDETSQKVKSVLEKENMVYLKFSRNFGKEAAILAGIDQARGCAAIIMDADLQHPVSMFPRFIEKWQEGYQNVYAIREHRKDEGRRKRIFTMLFYKVVNMGARVDIPNGALDFRLIDRKLVNVLKSMREDVRFTKGMYVWAGFRSAGIPFEPQARFSGRSRFNMRSLFHLALDGITSFSNLPLQIASAVGATVSLLSLAYAFFVLLSTIFFGADVPGWATLTVAVAGLSGVQLLCLGIIGRYLGNVNLEVKKRPNYVVDELIVSSSLPSLAPPLPTAPSTQSTPSRARTSRARTSRAGVSRTKTPSTRSAPRRRSSKKATTPMP